MPNLYQGVVSTRNYGVWNGQKDTTNKQLQARSTHYARTTIVNPKVMIPNSFVLSGVETGLGAAITVSASFEYPPLTCFRAPFSGLNDGSVPNNDVLTSDSVMGLTIPAGQQFHVNYFLRSATGVLYTAAQSNAPFISGDGIKLAVSGLTDQTMTGGPITGGSSGIGFFPAAVIASTLEPSIFIPGDSITYGNLCDPNAVGDKGALAPSLGSLFAYAQVAVPGERVANFNNSSTIRRKVVVHCSHCLTNMGNNDIAFDGVSAVTLQARYATMAALLPFNVRFMLGTLSPFSNTTDACTTLAGQNHDGLAGPRILERNAFNDALRADWHPGGGYIGFFEIADLLETSRNSGFWNTSPQHSNDCGHFSSHSANTVLPNSGIFNTSRIFMPNTSFLKRV